jgi:hypothetical protein
MDTRGENGFHHLRRRGTIVGRPVNEPLWRPFRIVLVGGRHVRCDRAVTAFERGAPRARHAFPRVEEFHHLRTETHVERLRDQHIGHGVVMAVDVDIVINIDTGLFPLGLFIRFERERPERRALERVKQRLA